MRKRRHREVKGLAQGHSARTWQSWDSNSCGQVPESQEEGPRLQGGRRMSPIATSPLRLPGPLSMGEGVGDHQVPGCSFCFSETDASVAWGQVGLPSPVPRRAWSCLSPRPVHRRHCWEGWSRPGQRAGAEEHTGLGPAHPALSGFSEAGVLICPLGGGDGSDGPDGAWGSCEPPLRYCMPQFFMCLSSSSRRAQVRPSIRLSVRPFIHLGYHCSRPWVGTAVNKTDKCLAP